MKKTAKTEKVTKPAQAKEKARKALGKDRDPRLPKPGTVIQREHKGVVHEIKVLKEGFEYQGDRFTSLSAIAHRVTGTIWNGFLWANLTKREPAPSPSRRPAPATKEG